MVRNLLFFFFKQKTAYEMRISDWSSDVCSSDLQICLCGEMDRIERRIMSYALSFSATDPAELWAEAGDAAAALVAGERDGIANMANVAALIWQAVPDLNWAGFRSEEHTSELQSLMRMPYAVFCSNNKNHKN